MRPLLVLVVLAGCPPELPRPQPLSPIDTLHGEPGRPQLHFSPPSQWLNDPNGLVWFDGEYHLFYQHNPDDSLWGPMHWGHAVSTDLLHWTHLPLALSPDPVLGEAWSGSALADPDNDTGLCGSPRGCLIALLTHHGGADGTEKQSLAISDDRGRTWSLHPDSPVLPNPGGLDDFRDPKVFRHRGRWVMVLAAGDHVALYGSRDLLDWTWLSDFGPAGLEDVGAWECPDLFALPTPDGGEAWVLQVDSTEGSPWGGSGNHWFLGSFDGTRFDGTLQGPVDHGADFYAAQSWSDTPDGDRVWIAWMSNWRYAMLTPTDPWRGAMTLPRTVSLVSRGDDLRLAQRPVSLDPLVRDTRIWRDREVTVQTTPVALPSGLARLWMQLDLSDADGVEVRFESEEGAHTDIGWQDGQLYVDRSQSGQVAFSPSFPARHQASLPRPSGPLTLEIVVDWSSVEVFGDEGTVVLTDQVFPSSPYRSFTLASSGRTVIEALVVQPLDTIWSP